MNTPTAADLRHYDDDMLDFFWDRVEAFRPAITELRKQRAVESERWNSASRLSAYITTWKEYRHQVGWNQNGLDEYEADTWQDCEQRIRFLRRCSLRRMRHRTMKRGR